MGKFLFGLASVALVAGATQASAQIVNFGLTGNSSTSGTDANFREFTGSDGSTRVRVTGWSITGTAVQDSYLGAYGSGLGVTSGDENGGNETHTTDNQNRIDFMLFQFSRPVNFLSATFTTYQVNGIAADSDAQIKAGNTSTLWTNQAAFNTLLNNGTTATLNSLFGTTFNSDGTSAGGNRTFGINGVGYGNLYLVSAKPGDLCSTNCTSVDAFKFSNLSVAVPEPATWAMVIGGFGLLGGVMRRRRQAVSTRFVFVR